jgi:indole-3-glycerol phosphate synthase/phosphoribosylanthranilate isomerase
VALAEILAAKRDAVRERQARRPLAELQRLAGPAVRDFLAALRQSPCAYVLECKVRSPSRGVLAPDGDVLALARAYAPFASALSVLTDEPFFGGRLADLAAVAGSCDRPVLCKDFVLGEYQVWEARVHGADAVLLMAAVLDDGELARCLAVARQLGMAALVEVHDEVELARVLPLGPRLVGINNRRLADLSLDLATTERLAPRVPPGPLLLAESGVSSHADVRRLRPLVDGFLVGSALSGRRDVGRAVRELLFGRVKVCGLTRAGDARAAWDAGAVLGGLIFASASPRRVTLAQATELVAAVPELAWVGVFVDAPAGTMIDAARQLGLHALQLHGDEPPALLATLRGELPDVTLIKAVPVAAATAGPATFGADRLLVDGCRPGARGGTGACVDWTLLPPSPGRDELFLAGGLGPANVAQAAALGVGVLDVNSGVESGPGVKDPARLRALFAALRGQGGRRREAADATARPVR